MTYTIHDPNMTRRALRDGRRGAVALLFSALALTGCFLALPEGPPVEPQEPDPQHTPEWIVPADNDSGRLNSAWHRGKYRKIHACELLDDYSAGRILGAAFDPPEAISVFGRNTCAIKEPLQGNLTRSELWLLVWSPQEAQVMEAQWEANPDARVDTSHIPLEAAYFDPGSSDTPGRSTLDNGLIAITAYANLQFKSHGVWMTLQATGEVAIRSDLSEQLLEVADVVDLMLDDRARR